MASGAATQEWQEEAQGRISKLLGKLGVTRVILVDDDAYKVSKQIVRQAEVPKLGESKWDRKGSYADFLDAEWGKLSALERREAQDRSVKKEPSLAGGDIDVMRVLFKSPSWSVVTPGDWSANRHEFVTSENVEQTLVFFDVDLGQGASLGGADLLREYWQTHPNGRALLLTSTVSAEKLSIDSQIVQRAGRPASELLVASKSLLTRDTATEFADLVRTSLSLPNIKMIREGVGAALESSHKTALKELNDLSPQVVEDMVIRASRAEGVWEIDTYLRVFSILLRHSLHRAVVQHKSEDLRAAIDRARDVARIDHGDHRPSKRRVGHLMAKENYASGKVINEARLPLENGDIFRLNGELYVVVMQPCDLTFRDDGTGVREKTDFCRLVKLSRQQGRAKGRQEPLPLGLPTAMRGLVGGEGRGEFFAELNTVHHLALELLDLCTFDSKGWGRMDLDGEAPHTLVPRQTTRYEGLLKKVEESKAKVEADPDAEILLDYRGDLKVEPEWKRSNAELWFDLQRVARLSAPYSAQLLTAFAHDVSRAAYDPPLNRFY